MYTVRHASIEFNTGVYARMYESSSSAAPAVQTSYNFEKLTLFDTYIYHTH